MPSSNYKPSLLLNSLRKYSIPDVVIGGNRDCKHEFEIEHTPIRDNKGKPGPNSIMGDKQIEGCESTRDIKSGFCIHCRAWQGQHGLEPSFKLYLEHCKLWMQEAIRVLRDDGVIFINLADSYASNGGASRHKGYNDPKYPNGRNGEFAEPTSYPQGNVKPKSKLLIPERFAIMCVDELGLILRNHIVWYAPNKMPESCQDRFSKKWESIFMFTKQEKYYFDLDAVREPHQQVSIDRLNRAVSNSNKWVNGADGQTPHNLSQPRPNRTTKISKEEAEMFGSPRARYHREGANTGENNKEPYKQNNPHATRLINSDTNYKTRDPERCVNPKGKNPGDLWSIPTQPSPEKHFAMWPEALVRRMILCSTKPGDIVCDPFCGSGTSLRVADKLNRIGIGIDLGYNDIQSRRLSAIQKELL